MRRQGLPVGQSQRPYLRGVPASCLRLLGELFEHVALDHSGGPPLTPAPGPRALLPLPAAFLGSPAGCACGASLDDDVPPEIAGRPKQMFRAPFEAYRTDQSPAFVEQLLSESA